MGSEVEATTVAGGDPDDIAEAVKRPTVCHESGDGVGGHLLSTAAGRLPTVD